MSSDDESAGPPRIVPTLFDRLLSPVRHLLLTLAVRTSDWHEEHGFETAALPPTGISEASCRSRLSEALQVLIRTYPVRVQRIRTDMPRILIAGTGRDRRAVAAYVPAWRMCLLDPAYVVRDDVSSATLAAAIVHEATHARLLQRGHRHRWPVSSRIEGICIRREAAFLRRATVTGAPSDDQAADPRGAIHFAANDAVRVKSGPHAGRTGAVICLLSLDPEATFLVEPGDEPYGDLQISQSALELLDKHR